MNAKLSRFLTLLLGAAVAAANPYPPSPILEGISWNEASKQRYAADSDLWDSAWASDGNVYAGWGDGEGFSGRTKAPALEDRTVFQGEYCRFQCLDAS